MATQSLLCNSTPGHRETRVVVPRILVVDDDEAVRAVIKEHLSSNYEIVETGASETVLSLTVAHRPDAILLDLSMPGLSGFELCRALTSLSFTQQIPIVIVSGQDERNSAFCLNLGAVRYFRKPLDFTKLKAGLAQVLKETRDDRRSHVRFALRAILKLRAKSKDGSHLEIRAVTENIGSGGFLCACSLPFEEVSLVEVFSWDEREYYLGQARLVRIEQACTSNPRYAFQFMGPFSPAEAKAH
jgi:CheY-like chemotaxis protein